MKKEIIFFLFLALFLLFLSNLTLAAKCTKNEDCPKGLVCQEGKCVRALEIVYPNIGKGVPAPKYVTTGLPQYVEYIFRLAIWLIGFLIFGAVVYNGVNYLLAAGNPAKLADAKDGIISALLGGVILLGTYIIFNTINPQMVILEQAELPLVGAEIEPGVYLCNYEIINIGTILSKYTAGTTQERTEAAEELWKAMGPKDGNKLFCLKVRSSGNLAENFNFYLPKEKNTWFIIPFLSDYNPETTRYTKQEWDYGIVLHEKDNFGGRCLLLPPTTDSSFRPGVTDFHLNLGFDAHSVTLFRRLPSETGQGTVTLYSHQKFNEEVKGGEKVVAKEYKITGQEIKRVPETDLQTATGTLSQNTRSIKIEGPPFALLYESPNFNSAKDKCELIKSSDSNLWDNPIGRCGGVCNIVGEKGWYSFVCYPCLRSMIIVKGTVL